MRFDHYGPVDVLEVVEVEKPTPGPGQVRVEVVATSINPGEIAIREGAMAKVAPSTFASGRGSDLAGRIVEIGGRVDGWNLGEEVIGWTDERAAQAEFVTVPADQLTARPPSVPWEQAGSIYVASGTARGMADAVPAGSGETVVVFAATGGVGSILTQLLVSDGVRVLAVAGPANDEWVRSVGAEPVHFGEGLAQWLREAAPDGIDAAKQRGAKTVFGYQVTSAGVLTELAQLIEAGELTVPIAATFPLAQVREAYTQLSDLVGRAAHRDERIVLTRHGWVVAALVPIAVLRELEDVEDAADLAAAREAAGENGPNVRHALVLADLVADETRALRSR